MNSYLPTNVFTAIMASGTVLLVAVLGYIVRRVQKNRDCLETTIQQFSQKVVTMGERVEGFEGKIEPLRTDIMWIKTSLERIEAILEKVRNNV